MTEHDIVPALEFNAVFCSDPVARVYFGLAADRIKECERECARLRRRLAFERTATHSIEVEAKALESALAIIIEKEPHP